MADSTKPKHTPLSILNAFYNAERVYMSSPPETRDFSGMAATISPNMTLYQTPNLPYSGTYHGVAGFKEHFDKMGQYYNEVDVQDVEVFEGKDGVVVYCDVRFVIKKTGKEERQRLCQVVKVDLEGGVMKEMRVFYWDVKGLVELFGAES
jgi:uncharacterized protein